MNGRESEVKIKTEPGLAAGRLSSFKPPRDLTLGANKTAAKKVFVPNLNAVRNKNKSVSGSNDTSSDRRRDGRGGGAPGRGNRGPGGGERQKPAILKAGGVFSEGVAASARHPSSRGYSGSREARDEPQALQKPTIKPKESLKLDKEMEVQQIKELTNDEEELDLLAEHFGPTRLPVSKHCENFFKTKSEDDVKPKPLKPEVVIKSEPMDAEDNMGTMVQAPPEIKPDKKVKMEYEFPADAQNLFKTQTPTLLLLQFPDSLPGRGPEDDESANIKNSKEAQSVTDPNLDKPKINVCTARHLEEGQIGKIQIHKSGKIKMLIGQTLYDLSLGTQACFRQDVMSVNLNSEQRSGNVVNLGPIQSKITITPNWESMFQQMETN